jgi:biopolymer transport protein ExbD
MRLFRGIDVGALASILVVLALVLLVVGWMPPTHHAYSVDLAYVGHPALMPGAKRDDAMIITVTRNGLVSFGGDHVAPADLPAKIQDRLRDRGVERKVYIRVDLRAKWGAVKLVLDGVRSAGILRVAFLVDQRRSSN